MGAGITSEGQSADHHIAIPGILRSELICLIAALLVGSPGTDDGNGLFAMKQRYIAFAVYYGRAILAYG